MAVAAKLCGVFRMFWRANGFDLKQPVLYMATSLAYSSGPKRRERKKSSFDGPTPTPAPVSSRTDNKMCHCAAASQIMQGVSMLHAKEAGANLLNRRRELESQAFAWPTHHVRIITP